jgi:Bacterial SH3 domain
MPKQERPLVVEIPRPGSEKPAWSRVGIIGIAGFVLGIVWPRVAGIKVGPGVPSDLAAKMEATAAPSGSAGAPPAAGSPSGGAAVPSLAASAESAAGRNEQLVVVGAGKITRCSDKKDRKVDDCEKLQFDPVAVKKLKELSRCPSALGLAGKMTIGFEVNFEKKEVQVAKVKKGSTLPTTTVNGILQCAAREFANVSLEEVPHKYRRYTLAYALTFYPPGKHPEATEDAKSPEDASAAAGSTTDESEASGTAVVTVDTALLRKEPKSKEKVGRLVRGTKVKLLGRQNDWFKVEADSNVGWIYRSVIGR